MSLEDGLNILRDRIVEGSIDEKTYYPKWVTKGYTKGCIAPGGNDFDGEYQLVVGGKVVDSVDAKLYYTGNTIHLIKMDGKIYVGTAKVNIKTGDQFIKRNGRAEAREHAIETIANYEEALTLLDMRTRVAETMVPALENKLSELLSSLKTTLVVTDSSVCHAVIDTTISQVVEGIHVDKVSCAVDIEPSCDCSNCSSGCASE